MNQDTVDLLKECNAGCKSATNSLEQVQPYVTDKSLKKLLDEYNDKHIKLGDRCHQMLNAGGEKEKDPQPVAKVMSWLGTEMKLMMNDQPEKIADLMVDGCNMGIKSVSGYMNKYKTASTESMEIAKELVTMEQDFQKRLLSHL